MNTGVIGKQWENGEVCPQIQEKRCGGERECGQVGEVEATEDTSVLTALWCYFSATFWRLFKIHTTIAECLCCG
jgi:hypothetical protein